jgi:hypothetical protein
MMEAQSFFSEMSGSRKAGEAYEENGWGRQAATPDWLCLDTLGLTGLI